MKMFINRQNAVPRLHPVLLLFLVCVTAFCSLSAEERYIAIGQPDGRFILPAPPATNSPEAIADLASARAIFKARTPSEEAHAIQSATLAFSLFAPAVGPVMDLDKLPKTDALLQKVKKEVGDTINLPKNHWKRSRPYESDPALLFGRPEKSDSYPSGHSTRGMLYALVMAELFPENRDAILNIGRGIGWDRVLIGKHYPTDIFAGRVLAIATMRELSASPLFQRDLAAAKAEIAAARKSLK